MINPLFLKYLDRMDKLQALRATTSRADFEAAAAMAWRAYCDEMALAGHKVYQQYREVAHG